MSIFTSSVTQIEAQLYTPLKVPDELQHLADAWHQLMKTEMHDPHTPKIFRTKKWKEKEQRRRELVYRMQTTISRLYPDMVRWDARYGGKWPNYKLKFYIVWSQNYHKNYAR